MTFLAATIIEGRRLRADEEQVMKALVEEDLAAVCAGADAIRGALVGDKVDLCTIVSGKTGACSEDCKFCAQSSCSHAEHEVHALLGEEEIVAACTAQDQAGADRFAVVTAGRTLNGEDFEKILPIYRKLDRKCDLDLCASFGFLSEEQLRQLQAAGVTTYHHNLETSRRFFPEICTTHTYDMKLRTLKAARDVGLRLCSGGIIGMGETWQDRLDLALELAALKVESIPINALIPIAGTPLAGREPLREEDILRTVAVFRYLNPTAQIRLAAGRGLLQNGGEAAFRSGANAAISGNMLTTAAAATVASDREMLKKTGRKVRRV